MHMMTDINRTPQGNDTSQSLQFLHLLSQRKRYLNVFIPTKYAWWQAFIRKQLGLGRQFDHMPDLYCTYTGLCISMTSSLTLDLSKFCSIFPLFFSCSPSYKLTRSCLLKLALHDFFWLFPGHCVHVCWEFYVLVPHPLHNPNFLPLIDVSTII